MDIFMVLCLDKGKQVRKVRFNNYDEALDYATSLNESQNWTCLILQMDNETLKWKRRLVIYPRESC